MLNLKILQAKVCSIYNITARELTDTSFRMPEYVECRWAIGYLSSEYLGYSIRRTGRYLNLASSSPIQVGLKRYPLILSGERKSVLNEERMNELKEFLSKHKKFK